MSPPTIPAHSDLAEHPKRDALAKLVRLLTVSAAQERHVRFADGLEEAMAEADLTLVDGRVGAVNVIESLGASGAPSSETRPLLAELLARGVSLDPPSDEAAARSLVRELCWLAANSPIDPLPSLREQLGADGGDWLHEGLGSVVTSIAAEGYGRGRGPALVAAVALAGAPGAAAQRARERALADTRDPLLREALRSSPGPADGPAPAPAARLVGRLVPAPLGPVGLLFWSLSGLILVRYLWRFIAVALLRAGHPAELRVSGGAVRLDSKLRVLGRTVRARSQHIAADNLASVTLQARYPRLAMYAGLLALAVGSYLGALLVTDGARAGSPSLIAIGAALVAAGVLLDLALGSLLPTKRGDRRILMVPRKGRRIAIQTADEVAARRALDALRRAA